MKASHFWPNASATPERPSTHDAPGVDLARRVRFETLLSNLAASLITVSPEEMDEAIQASLGDVCAFIGSEGGALGIFSEDGRSLRFEYGYFGPGSNRILFQTNLLETTPWWAGELWAGRPVILRRVPEDIPPEAEAERAVTAAIGMRSSIGLPLKVGGDVLGAFGATHHAAYCSYPSELVTQLELMVNIYANTLFRRRAWTKLQAASDLTRSVLESVSSEIVLLDGEGRFVTANAAWARSARPADPVPAGTDYVVAFERAIAQGQVTGEQALNGLRAVLLRDRPTFHGTYGCTVADGSRRRYVLDVSRQAGGGGVVVVHTDVTELEATKTSLEKSLEELRALERQVHAENVLVKAQVRTTQGYEEIVGTSDAMSRVLAQVEQVAQTDAPVLLLGETGTGKDLLARALHERSRRSDGPMVTVNCAALPASLIESELFGHEKGAFTGAVQRFIGRFEVAHGGSLFLDEIGDLPSEAQAKLLRVLQSGQFERLGSTKTITVDVRLIAATNRDLERDAREGHFRRDLFYRLSVFPITLPPLRERPEDVPLLVWHFIARRQAKLGRSVKRVPERMMRAFAAYAWPGNVRELENVVERALIMTNGTTLAVDPLLLEAAPAEPAPGTTLAEVERAHILDVLNECGWRLSGRGNAADRLGLNRSTLQFRLKKLGITRPRDAG